MKSTDFKLTDWCYLLNWFIHFDDNTSWLLQNCLLFWLPYNWLLSLHDLFIKLYFEESANRFWALTHSTVFLFILPRFLFKMFLVFFFLYISSFRCRCFTLIQSWIEHVVCARFVKLFFQTVNFIVTSWNFFRYFVRSPTKHKIKLFNQIPLSIYKINRDERKRKKKHSFLIAIKFRLGIVKSVSVFG